VTLDAAGAARVIAAARQQRVFLMEAFMDRCHPLLRELPERLKDGAIGPVRHVRADFGFRVRHTPSTDCSMLRWGAAASWMSAVIRSPSPDWA
jgi:predicted dehydrogenase